MPTVGRAIHYFAPAVFALVLLSARASSSRGEIMQRSRARAHIGRLVPILREWGQCTDKKHDLTVTDVKIESYQRGEERWTLNFNLSQPLKSFQRLRVLINKCNANNDACEYWNTWSWDTAVCSLLFANNTVWSPLIQSMTPRFNCPMQAGHYTAVNATLDIDSLGAPTRAIGEAWERYTWRVEVQLYNELRQLYICILSSMKLVRLKSRT